MIYRIVVQVSMLLSYAMVLSIGSRDAIAETTAKRSVKRYFAEVEVYSLKPDDGIESVNGQFHGGGVGPGGTFSSGIMQGKRQIEFSLQGLFKEGRFIVKMTASESVGAKSTEIPTLNNEFDLTDLESKSIELAKDPDGRVYKLRIVPRIIESPKASIFDVRELRLEHFSFNNSMVLLDDHEYLGTMSMFSGVLVHVDISGMAKIEFSLIPFKGASEQGQLLNGTINIHHEGRSIQIQNVKNGAQPTELQGGPHTLYVRWSKPTYSEVEARQIWKQQVDELRRKLENGEGNMTEATLRVIEQNSERRRGLIDYGVGPIGAADK